MREEHLSDEQFGELLLGTPNEAEAAHVARCEACSAELARVSGAVGRVSQMTRAAAERPAGFWYAQRRTIAEQLEARPLQSKLLAWAGALAVLVLAAVMMGRISVAPRLGAGGDGTIAGSGTAVERDPDDALMVEIQASVRREVPRAFEPALLVTQELHRAAEANQSQP